MEIESFLGLVFERAEMLPSGLEPEMLCVEGEGAERRQVRRNAVAGGAAVAVDAVASGGVTGGRSRLFRARGARKHRPLDHHEFHGAKVRAQFLDLLVERHGIGQLVLADAKDRDVALAKRVLEAALRVEDLFGGVWAGHQALVFDVQHVEGRVGPGLVLRVQVRVVVVRGERRGRGIERSKKAAGGGGTGPGVGIAPAGHWAGTGSRVLRRRLQHGWPQRAGGRRAVVDVLRRQHRLAGLVDGRSAVDTGLRHWGRRASGRILGHGGMWCVRCSL